jgi:TonB family protein
MSVLAILVAFFWSMSSSQQPMEKQALALAQRVPVSDLENGLPASQFSSWFEQIVGLDSGVSWQLGECGKSINDPTLASIQRDARDSNRQEIVDIPACVEANAVLPDGRKVVVMIKVGSFTKGITGNPEFNLAMIEQGDELYLIKRLGDLPRRISAQPYSAEKLDILSLPEAEATPRFGLLKDFQQGSLDVINNNLLSGASIESIPPPLPPPPVPDQRPRRVSPSAKKEYEPKRVLQGQAVTKVQPAYPISARRFNVAGQVQVQVDISERGRVTEAKAINGHPLLRDAAAEAARKWVFNPTTFDGIPVTTQIVLTFDFTVPD